MPSNQRELPPMNARETEKEARIKNAFKNGVDIILKDGTTRRIYSLEEQITALSEDREN